MLDEATSSNEDKLQSSHFISDVIALKKFVQVILGKFVSSTKLYAPLENKNILWCFQYGIVHVNMQPF